MRRVFTNSVRNWTYKTHPYVLLIIFIGYYDCDYCELQGICSNPDKLLAFMMQPAADDDQQLLQEPQGTV